VFGESREALAVWQAERLPTTQKSLQKKSLSTPRTAEQEVRLHGRLSKHRSRCGKEKCRIESCGSQQKTKKTLDIPWEGNHPPRRAASGEGGFQKGQPSAKGNRENKNAKKKEARLKKGTTSSSERSASEKEQASAPRIPIS